MFAPSHDDAQPPAPEPALRFRHIPLLFIALSAAIAQPYASSFGELALSAGLTVLALTPPVLQLLRYFRQRPRAASVSRRATSPIAEWGWALLLVSLANLIFLINLILLRGALFAR